MRIVETAHPNFSHRTYMLDKKIVDSSYFTAFDRKKEGTDVELGVLFDTLSELPLVKEVGFSKYEIRVTVVDAFAHEAATWKPIQEGIIKELDNYFDERVDFTSALQKRVEEDRAKREADEARIEELAKILAAQIKASTAVHHNFETHKESWRNGMVVARQAARDDLNAPSEERDTAILYWDHEIKAYDEAFEQLLSLKLPQK